MNKIVERIRKTKSNIASLEINISIAEIEKDEDITCELSTKLTHAYDQYDKIIAEAFSLAVATNSPQLIEVEMLDLTEEDAIEFNLDDGAGKYEIFHFAYPDGRYVESEPQLVRP